MKLRAVLLFAASMLCVAATAQTTFPAKYVQVVDKMPTSLTLSSSSSPAVGLPVTFMAQVNPAIRGSVEFSIDPSQTQSQQIKATSDGVAYWTTTIQQPGTYTVLAQYPGDQNHLASSGVLTLNVGYAGQPDFSIAVGTASSIIPGQTWTAPVTLKSINGFAQNVALSCGDGLDSTMKCTFTPSSMTPTADGVSGTLAITTSGATVSVARGFLLPFLGLLPFAGRRRRRRRILAFLGLLGCLAIAGCGVPRHFVQSNGTPAGTYQIDVVGTSGATSHTAFATVVVQ
jgi:hypothetical protein